MSDLAPFDVILSLFQLVCARLPRRLFDGPVENMGLVAHMSFRIVAAALMWLALAKRYARNILPRLDCPRKIKMGHLTRPKTLLNNTCPYPLMLVSVVTEHDVCCGVAADDRRVSKVRVEKIIQTVVCLLWGERNG
jgi:hypothetical protein